MKQRKAKKGISNKELNRRLFRRTLVLLGVLGVLAVLALGAALVLFTFLPPDCPLFLDLSGVNTWSTIPY